MSMPRRISRLLTGVWGRWLLVGLVMAGIVGMHVLSEQDSGAGHGMVMTPQSMAPGQADGHVELVAGTMVMADADAHGGHATVAASVVAAAGGMSGSMAMCLLFLGAGAAALGLLLMLRLRRADRTKGHASTTAGGCGLFLRGPPGGDPPRIALCVLRV